MIESGNPHQWGHTYPSKDLIRDDIESEVCYLVCDDDGIHGVFALLSGAEPSYHHIEDGQWLNDDEYVTVHRITGDGVAHGIFGCAASYCKGISDNVRIDTHEKNTVMQKLIERNGFKRCGTVYVRDGSPRIAYHWSKY